MRKKKISILLGIFAILLFIAIICTGTVYYYLFAPQFHPPKTTYIYICLLYTSDAADD